MNQSKPTLTSALRDRRLAVNSAIVMLAFSGDKGLAVIRDLVIGRRFGAGYEYDAFTAAIQGPELLFTLLAGGALLAAFIPVLSQHISGRPAEERWRLASAIFNLVVLILLAVGAAVGLLAEPICARWLVPHFSPEKQALTARLLRIVLLQTSIFGAAGVIVGVLHAHQHFFLPAIAPLFYNAGQIFGAVVLVPRLGIDGLTWGMVLGAAGYLLVQTPAMAWLRARYVPTLGLRLAGVRRVAWLMLPRLVALGLVELADVFFVRLGSRLPDGHLSAYFWGWRIMQLPETLFGTAIAQVFFPTFAELANTGDWATLRAKANAALRVILTLNLPAAAGLALLGGPLVSLVGGAFDQQAVHLVQAVLVVFAVRLPGEALLEIAARLFYARQDTVTPMLAAGASQLLGISAAYVLIDHLGHRGLALATTVAFWTQTLILLALVQRGIGRVLDGKLVLALERALVGSAAFGLAAWLLLERLPMDGRWQTAISVGVAGLAASAAYLVTLFLLRSPELRALPQLVRSPRVPLDLGGHAPDSPDLIDRSAGD